MFAIMRTRLNTEKLEKNRESKKSKTHVGLWCQEEEEEEEVEEGEGGKGGGAGEKGGGEGGGEEE